MFNSKVEESFVVIFGEFCTFTESNVPQTVGDVLLSAASDMMTETIYLRTHHQKQVPCCMMS